MKKQRRAFVIVKSHLGLVYLLLLLISVKSLSFAWANGLSQQVVSQEFQSRNAGNPTYSPLNNMNGRDYKAQNASSTGMGGAAVAAATGAALIGAGVPLSQSIDPIEVAAGLDLISKGGMELAQSISDAATSQQNAAQNNLLTNGLASQNAQYLGMDANALPSSLTQMLNQKGIDPQAFAQQLASGTLTPSQLANTLQVANPATLSAQSQQAASLLAQDKMSTLSANSSATNASHGNAPSGENAGSTLTQNASGSAAMMGSGASWMLSQNTGLSSPRSSLDVSSTPQAQSSTGVAQSPKTLAPVSESDFENTPSLKSGGLHSLLALLGKKQPNSGEAAVKESLLESGIHWVRQPESRRYAGIFQIAHVSYWQFSHWRDNKQVKKPAATLPTLVPEATVTLRPNVLQARGRS